MFSRSLILLFLALGVSAAERTFDFGELGGKQASNRFHSAVTGRGQPGDWRILQEDVPLNHPRRVAEITDRLQTSRVGAALAGPRGNPCAALHF